MGCGMKQYEAVIEVMRRNGGWATLAHLYQNVFQVPGVKWGTKTPKASVRRIVQDERFFFKIRPGLWALKECRDNVPFMEEATSAKTKEKFTHTYFQGLLVQLGNIRGFETHVPPQDSNKIFLDRPLADIVTVKECYAFGYDRFVRAAKTVDVTWFNSRKMPACFYEIEHTTDVGRSLEKFVELQDFMCEFIVICPQQRRRHIEDRLKWAAFEPVKGRVKVMDEERVPDLLALVHPGCKCPQ